MITLRGTQLTEPYKVPPPVMSVTGLNPAQSKQKQSAAWNRFAPKDSHERSPLLPPHSAHTGEWNDSPPGFSPMNRLPIRIMREPARQPVRRHAL